MDYNQMAKEIHMNAVAHGFWDDPDPDTLVALIHAEWSEALESYRNGESALWYKEISDCTSKNFRREKKPEGWAVELVDGVIRILDIAASDLDIMVNKGGDYMCEFENFCTLICQLHALTAARDLMGALGMVIAYLMTKGIDADELITRKHEYNKGRPYKHGKKF